MKWRLLGIAACLPLVTGNAQRIARYQYESNTSSSTVRPVNVDEVLMPFQPLANSHLVVPQYVAGTTWTLTTSTAVLTVTSHDSLGGVVCHVVVDSFAEKHLSNKASMDDHASARPSEDHAGVTFDFFVRNDSASNVVGGVKAETGAMMLLADAISCLFRKAPALDSKFGSVDSTVKASETVSAPGVPTFSQSETVKRVSAIGANTFEWKSRTRNVAYFGEDTRSSLGEDAATDRRAYGSDGIVESRVLLAHVDRLFTTGRSTPAGVNYNITTEMLLRLP